MVLPFILSSPIRNALFSVKLDRFSAKSSMISEGLNP